MRNVSGEILGCMNAIQYAIDHHYPSICIYYDYEGIEKWATGLWKANKEQTQNYVKTINDMKKKIDIYFQRFSHIVGIIIMKLLMGWLKQWVIKNKA